ncbi:MAG: DUF1667 domain-containing protein [Synergistaceae bacterium]|jgi:CxxC motif-containing protein|nr:DUF1667 domain-containing protein [Synergistaceae bacterium]
MKEIIREMICIVCPNGCRLTVDDSGEIGGYQCERGLGYARDETVNPTRVLTSTVRVIGGVHRRCPVKTDRPVPKGLLMKAMERVNAVELTAPVECGQIILGNLLGTESNLVTTREIGRAKEIISEAQAP